MKILTIGQGEIGAPLTTLLLNNKKNTVYAKDIEPLELKVDLDVMIISIPFKTKDSFCKTVEEYAKQYCPNLIIINSTVLPGTSDKIFNTTSIKTVHSPIMGRHRSEVPEMMLRDIKAYPKFIGANDNESYELAKKVFSSIGLKSYRMSSTKTSELSKLLETTYSGILIGWMQEIERLSNKYGVDWKETLKLPEAANQRIEFIRPTNLYPGLIGGHCIMPNIELLLQENTSNFLSAVIKSNKRKQQEGAIDEVRKSK